MPDRKGKDIPWKGVEDENGVGTNSGKSGTRNVIWRLRESEVDRRERDGL